MKDEKATAVGFRWISSRYDCKQPSSPELIETNAGCRYQNPERVGGRDRRKELI